MSEVSLNPIGKKEIHKLESALLIGSILRPDVLEELKSSEERLTWVDSLAVAAAALAREKAKMSVSQIADEIGRAESTIRSHLQGKTKAGQIVRETYEKFAKDGINITLPEIFQQRTYNLEEAAIREELDRLRSQLQEERSKLESLKEILSRAADELLSTAENLRKAIQ